MKIYTRGGDGGQSGLLDGSRVWKNSPRLDACGTIDELNSTLGLIRSEPLPAEIDRLLERLQHELFNLGSQLVTLSPAEPPCPTITAKQVETMEAAIDQYEAKLPPIKGFILPGGVRSAALFQVARTICRRAERRLVALVTSEQQAVSPDILAYINRLSDLLFVLARLVNAQSGVGDQPWEKSN